MPVAFGDMASRSGEGSPFPGCSLTGSVLHTLESDPIRFLEDACVTRRIDVSFQAAMSLHGPVCGDAGFPAYSPQDSRSCGLLLCGSSSRT